MPRGSSVSNVLRGSRGVRQGSESWETVVLHVSRCTSNTCTCYCSAPLIQVFVIEVSDAPGPGRCPEGFGIASGVRHMEQVGRLEGDDALIFKRADPDPRSHTPASPTWVITFPGGAFSRGLRSLSQRAGGPQKPAQMPTCAPADTSLAFGQSTPGGRA